MKFTVETIWPLTDWTIENGTTKSERYAYISITFHANRFIVFEYVGLVFTKSCLHIDAVVLVRSSQVSALYIYYIPIKLTFIYSIHSFETIRPRHQPVTLSFFIFSHHSSIPFTVSLNIECVCV